MQNRSNVSEVSNEFIFLLITTKEKLLRGYRSKLDHVNNMTNSPRRTKNDDIEEDNYVPTADIEVDGVENVMLEVSKFESKVPMTTLKMKTEKIEEKIDNHDIVEDDNKDDIDDEIKEEKYENAIVEDKDPIEEEASPDLNGDTLNENTNDLEETEDKPITEVDNTNVEEKGVEEVEGKKDDDIETTQAPEEKEVQKEEVDKEEPTIADEEPVEAIAEEQNNDETNEEEQEKEKEESIQVNNETQDNVNSTKVEKKDEEEPEQGTSTTETQIEEVKEVPEESWRDMISRGKLHRRTSQHIILLGTLSGLLWLSRTSNRTRR